jgi:hypothetical protein
MAYSLAVDGLGVTTLPLVKLNSLLGHRITLIPQTLSHDTSD